MNNYIYLLFVILTLIYNIYSFLSDVIIIPIDLLINIVFIFVYYYYNMHNAKKLKRILTLPLLVPVYLLSFSEINNYQQIIEMWRYLSIMVIVFDYAYGPIEAWLFSNKGYWVATILIFLQFFGTLGFYKFEELSINQSFWLTFISATTVGYGDVSAHTVLGQIVTYIVVIFGNLIYGAILVGLIINWLKKRESDSFDGQIQQKVEYEFDSFRKGQATISELEQHIIRLINQEGE